MILCEFSGDYKYSSVLFHHDWIGSSHSKGPTISKTISCGPKAAWHQKLHRNAQPSLAQTSHCPIQRPLNNEGEVGVGEECKVSHSRQTAPCNRRITSDLQKDHRDRNQWHCFEQHSPRFGFSGGRRVANVFGATAELVQSVLSGTRIAALAGAVERVVGVNCERAIRDRSPGRGVHDLDLHFAFSTSPERLWRRVEIYFKMFNWIWCEPSRKWFDWINDGKFIFLLKKVNDKSVSLRNHAQRQRDSTKRHLPRVGSRP